MSAISETYNCANNILELVHVLPNVFFITNKNGKYESTDELPNDVRLKDIAKFHGIMV